MGRVGIHRERGHVHYAAAGVAHLFSVAAGLDTMVVGEPQILGQLRAAYAGADALRELFELDPQAAAAIVATVRTDPSGTG